MEPDYDHAPTGALMSEFDSDLADNLRAMDEARGSLLACLATLSDEQMDAGKRGGWSVRAVLAHVLSSETAYARVIARLRGITIAVDALEPAATIADAISRLRESRRVLVQAVDGVDEDAFYELQALGHEEYSVLSVLENVAMHDTEHERQVRELVDR